MQNVNFSTVYGDFAAKQPNYHQSDGGYSSSWSTTSSSSAAVSDAVSAFGLYHPRILMQHHQDMINRYNLCLTRLLEAAKEAEALRQENASLRSAYQDLNKQLSALIQTSVQNHYSLSDYSTRPFELMNSLRGLCFGSDAAFEELGEADVFYESPTSVMEGAVDADRVMLPKSISVRSNGYLKMMNQGGASHRGKTRGPTRSANPLNNSVDRFTFDSSFRVNVQQKAYVQGGKKEDEPLQLEVCNQGMLKTELCNKWQETGACPYGDQCQFAHGVEELRLVIRHPRYKTEVCRMVLAGNVHALTDQEKFMGHLKPRTR